MGHSSKSKLQKGCGACKPHKHRRAPQAHKKPLPELRYLGKFRRVRRHDIGDRLDP